MSKFKNAFENIKRLNVIFGGLNELADEMDKLETLEGSIASLHIMKGKLVGEVVELEANKKHVNDLYADDLKKAKDAKESYLAEELKYKNQLKSLQSELDVYAKTAHGILNAELKDKVDKFNIRESDKIKMLQSINAEVNQAQEKLKSVRAEMEKIKGSLG